MGETMQLAFIGSGTMGEAIIHALLGAGKLAPEQIVASDVLVKRGEELKARHGVRVTTDNVAAASEANIAILSVKPQVLPSVMPDLCGHIRPGALVFSIVAGMPIATISSMS